MDSTRIINNKRAGIRERRNRKSAMEVMLKEFPHLKEEDIKLEKVKKEDN